MRRALCSALLVLVAAVGLWSAAPVHVSASSAPPSTPPTTTGFLSGTVDVGNCISALPRPECDSEHKGDWHFYVTVAVLTAGLGFIAWRIARGIRARDRALDPERQR